ncbi:MAG: outer membrane protein transport protein [Legionella sp.]|nr:outer membrane protein transport protein [Legionella sp.]
MHKRFQTLRYSMNQLGLTAAMITFAVNTANAGAFSLYGESNGSAVGNYAAGIAAEAADASTGWYNPAGLALIHEKQAVFGGVGVFPRAQLTGSSTFRVATLPDYVQTYQNLSSSDGALVPSFHYALPLSENVTFGVSAVSPFGLRTNWPSGSGVRYAATMTELLTANLSPELGAKFSENVAVGAGIDFQYAQVKFNRMLGAPNVMRAFSPFLNLPATFLDSESYNRGHSFGLGFHAGILGLFHENHTRIGLNYQSQVRHQFHGYSELRGPLAQPGINITNPLSIATSGYPTVSRSSNLRSNSIDLPEIVTLSGYQDINERLALLGSVVYTGWGSLKTIELINAVAYTPPTALTSGGQILVDTVSNENYKNVWRCSLGANYRLQDQWMFRLGGGYDQTPVNDVDRDIRVPDTNRWALAIGAHYEPKPAIGIDVGYTHLFGIGHPRVHTVEALGSGSSFTLDANVNAYANLVGGQVTWYLDKKASI